MHGISERRERAMLRYPRITILTILFVAMLGGPRTASAQVLYGSVVGNVTDASGAAVPRATVTATNKGTNQSREAITDEGEVTGLPISRPAHTR
jgi:hypothetical protein